MYANNWRPQKSVQICQLQLIQDAKLNSDNKTNQFMPNNHQSQVVFGEKIHCRVAGINKSLGRARKAKMSAGVTALSTMAILRLLFEWIFNISGVQPKWTGTVVTNNPCKRNTINGCKTSSPNNSRVIFLMFPIFFPHQFILILTVGDQIKPSCLCKIGVNISKSERFDKFTMLSPQG